MFFLCDVGLWDAFFLGLTSNQKSNPSKHNSSLSHAPSFTGDIQWDRFQLNAHQKWWKLGQVTPAKIQKKQLINQEDTLSDCWLFDKDTVKN